MSEQPKERHFHRPAAEIEGSRAYRVGVLTAEYVCSCGQVLPHRRPLKDMPVVPDPRLEPE